MCWTYNENKIPPPKNTTQKKQNRNKRAFYGVPLILFFNKRDIFLDELQEFSLQNAFNDYNGGTDYTEAIKYIRYLFFNIIDYKVYMHVTCMSNVYHAQRIFLDTLRIIASHSSNCLDCLYSILPFFFVYVLKLNHWDETTTKQNKKQTNNHNK